MNFMWAMQIKDHKFFAVVLISSGERGITFTSCFTFEGYVSKRIFEPGLCGHCFVDGLEGWWGWKWSIGVGW